MKIAVKLFAFFTSLSVVIFSSNSYAQGTKNAFGNDCSESNNISSVPSTPIVNFSENHLP